MPLNAPPAAPQQMGGQRLSMLVFRQDPGLAGMSTSILGTVTAVARMMYCTPFSVFQNSDSNWLFETSSAQLAIFVRL
jgi:hypothetical protein